jgi:outer membrane protein TolC
MNTRLVLLLTVLSLGHVSVGNAQQTEATAPRLIGLREAVELALKHNHVVRIAQYKVEEKQSSKDVARSAYFPTLRNDSLFVHVTDTQFVEIPAGSLGIVDNSLIPSRSVILNQGGHTFATSGTQLTQPLTQLLKIKSINNIARAELKATQGKTRGTENEIALKVHQLYYKILVAQSRRSAIQAKIQASGDLQSERIQQVKYGATLEADLIESRAQSLQSQQELLSTDLQLSDLRFQFNDAIGLPLTTRVVLDGRVPEAQRACEREECIKLAVESHPEVAEARAEVEKAQAAVSLAKRDYVPDVEAFARHSYQDNVPFLARNFGTFGVHLSYNLFDGGRKRNTLRERDAQLAQAKENLARINDEVELRVQTAYNKLERTRQMVQVSEELLSLRKESRRVSAQQLEHGAALRSQAQAAVAQELDAKTLLLQSQLDYVQARDEISEAIGQTPQ